MPVNQVEGYRVGERRAEIVRERRSIPKDRVDNALRDGRGKIDTARRTVSLVGELEQTEREQGPPTEL